MVRQGNKQDASDLLNFRFATSPNRQQQSSQPQRACHRRTKEDRASARKKASSAMFYLHSSPDHAFLLSRQPDKHQSYSYNGPDSPVSWAAVKIVKALSTTDNDECCPICLDSFSCARITKCGHSFCLTCLIHHLQAAAVNNPYVAVKCPCCSIPLHLDDVRPVQFTTVQPPQLQQRLCLVKLHRLRTCPSPYVPRPETVRRESPQAAPSQTDADAVYSRFCYIDPVLYQQHLRQNLVELEALSIDTDLEALCQSLARDVVNKEMHSALKESAQEMELMERFAAPPSGMALRQPRHLWGSSHVLAEPPSPTRRSRGDSLSSETSSMVHRARGDSITSHDSHQSQQSGGPNQLVAGSMYLETDETAFYQAQDGTLCFLCGFNIKCLQYEYATTLPADGPPSRPPMPDLVEGRVQELERVHLTPEVRQRLRFLSHLPLYTDVCLVELSLGRYLSNNTKKHFRKEFGKRQQARANKTRAEQRLDERERLAEEARINELKARLQRIDPSDDFFQPVVPPVEPSFTSADFGPSISRVEGASSPVASSPPRVSFSSIARSSAFPGLASTEESFPALGSSLPAPMSRHAAPPPAWGRPLSKVVEEKDVGPMGASVGSKKKSKGKEIVLLSTGGHRGSS